MRYGTIFSMDYEPRMRLLAIGPSGRHSDYWNAMVIHDPMFPAEPTGDVDQGWQEGNTIMFNPRDNGIVIIEEPAA